MQDLGHALVQPLINRRAEGDMTGLHGAVKHAILRQATQQPAPAPNQGPAANQPAAPPPAANQGPAANQPAAPPPAANQGPAANQPAAPPPAANQGPAANQPDAPAPAPNQGPAANQPAAPPPAANQGPAPAQPLPPGPAPAPVPARGVRKRCSACVEEIAVESGEYKMTKYNKITKNRMQCDHCHKHFCKRHGTMQKTEQKQCNACQPNN